MKPEMTGWREGFGPWDPLVENGRLYGRGGADEALAMGLANRVVADGEARAAAEALAAQIAAFPQTCLRRDRLSSYEQWGLPLAEALKNECRHGRISLASGDAQSGAGRFREGEGRQGRI